MSKLPVQVSREGDLNFKRASKAFEKLAKASNEGCEKSKERAESHASDWDERAERCQEVGTQTENVGDRTVEFDSNDCKLMARIWRNCTEHMVSNSSTGREYNPGGLKPLTTYFTYAEIGKQGLGSGKRGDFANINELEGNFDILEDNDGTMSGYNCQQISVDDESTWPLWVRIEAQGFRMDNILESFGCPCSTPTPIEDPIRGEVYCQECGYINDGLQHFDVDMDMDHAEDEYDEFALNWTENDLFRAFGLHAQIRFEETAVEYLESEEEEQKKRIDRIWQDSRRPSIQFNFDANGYYIGERKQPPPLEYDARYIAETNMTVKVRNMMTGEYVTKVIHKISNEWSPNSERIGLGVTMKSQHDQKVWHARKKFDDHFARCNGHPGNCLECHRTDKRLQKLIAHRSH